MRYLIFILALIVADQAMKLAVLYQIGMQNEIGVVENFFYLHCIANDGAAFGLWAQHSGLLISLTSFVMGGLLVYIFLNASSQKPAILVVLSMILGGGIGNLIDRIRLGYVVDYLDFRVWPFIFNFADICVVAGCLALVALLLFSPSGRRSRRKRR